MSNLPIYKIIVTKFFKKQLKQLLKKDRFLVTSVKESLLNFTKQQAVSIGKGVYKIRLKSCGKGKSGGYRLYVFVVEVDGILAPICIYAKNKKENLTYEELVWYLTKTKEELMTLI